MAVTHVKKSTSRVRFFGIKLAADTKLVVNDVLVYEDEFAKYYNHGKDSNHLIEPTYPPLVLLQLVQRNNVLSQCIEAMEVNIDGTGHSIEPVDEREVSVNSSEKKKLEEFFKTPWIHTGMVTLRRKLRADLESMGNAYIEVVRNVKKEIVFLRHLDAKMMRLVKLGEPIEVDKVVRRGDSEFPAKMWVRERRFAMINGGTMLYFREFDSSREIDRKTGQWLESQTEVTEDEKGTEVIHLMVNKDPLTPYGIPRWINQLPSVLGSRKAEEFNLTFFDAGGTPPAAIFVQGGTLSETVAEQLRGYFSGGANQKHRVAVVEVASTSGSIDAPGNVKVSVERFGDTAKDTMFSAYDDRTADHVRTGFRLPPLFLGKAADYNFATAMTSYMVTEAQVFAPERHEFDEMINEKIIPALGVRGYKFVSKPITLKNVEVMLKALELGKGMMDGEEFVRQLNNVSGLQMTYSAEAEERSFQLAMGPKEPGEGEEDEKESSQSKPVAESKGNGMGKSNVVPLRKVEAPLQVVELVNKWSQAMGWEESSLSEAEKKRVIKKIERLSVPNRKLFNSILATKAFVNSGRDQEGMAEIAAACCTALHSE